MKRRVADLSNEEFDAWIESTTEIAPAVDFPVDDTPHCFVYWLYDETCVDPGTDGYVGISKSPEGRFKAHVKKNRWPDAKMMVIFEGTRDECYRIEHGFRSGRHIGWNKAPGANREPVFTPGSVGFTDGVRNYFCLPEEAKPGWRRGLSDASVSNLVRS